MKDLVRFGKSCRIVGEGSHCIESPARYQIVLTLPP